MSESRAPSSRNARAASSESAGVTPSSSRMPLGPVSRAPPELIPGQAIIPVLTSSRLFRRFINGSLPLVSPDLTQAGSRPTLSATLTTTALNGSSFQRFASCGLSPDARGLPSSLAQFHTSFPVGVFVAHLAVRNLQADAEHRHHHHRRADRAAALDHRLPAGSSVRPALSR